jgi:hypothetical protein
VVTFVKKRGRVFSPLRFDVLFEEARKEKARFDLQGSFIVNFSEHRRLLCPSSKDVLDGSLSATSPV